MLRIPGVVARLWGPVRPPRRPVCLGGGRKRKGGMQVTGLSCLRNSSVCACLTPHGPGTGSTASFPFRALAGEEHPCTLPLPLPSISHGKNSGVTAIPTVLLADGILRAGAITIPRTTTTARPLHGFSRTDNITGGSEGLFGRVPHIDGSRPQTPHPPLALNLPNGSSPRSSRIGGIRSRSAGRIAGQQEARISAAVMLKTHSPGLAALLSARPWPFPI